MIQGSASGGAGSGRDLPGRGTHWLELFEARLGGDALGPAERAAVLDACVGTHSYRRGESIVEDGDRLQPLHLIAAGWAVRVQALEDGTQQITDFILPGEPCDLARMTGKHPDNVVVALTPASAALLDCGAIRRAAEAHPRLALALLRLAFSEQAVLRQWLVCLGRLDKRKHLAHLLCELHHRLRRVGLVADHAFELPLTQHQLADAMGMTAVHTNRVLQSLRQEGVISLGNQHLRIHAPGRLKEIGEFDGAYLET